MTTYTLSRTSPRNTVLTDPEGTTVYKITTPFTLGDSVTTITRGDETIATINWYILKKNTVTMNGKTRNIDEAFPKPKTLSRSRIVAAPDGSGERFKWKNTIKLYCVSESTGLNVATYYRTLFSAVRDKKSTLDISPTATHLTDIIIVTWAIMEKEGED